MIALREIRKNALTQGMGTDCWQEVVEETHGKTREVLKRISERMQRDGVIATMDVLSGGKSEELTVEGISAFPNGKFENGIQAEFVGICRKRQLLSRVFREAHRYCMQYKRLSQKEKEKRGKPSVTIITDKWNSHVFHRFEAKYIQAMLDDGIDFYFFLVTDYGMTQIPFLPNDQMATLQELHRGDKVLGSGSPEEIAAVLGIEKVSCEFRPPAFHDRVGGWERFSFTICDHYLVGNDYWTWQAENNDHKEGRLPKEAVTQFIGAMEEIYRQLQEAEEEDFWTKEVEDEDPAPYLKVKIFGKKLWITDKRLKQAGDNAPVDRMKKELETLIEVCMKQ